MRPRGKVSAFQKNLNLIILHKPSYLWQNKEQNEFYPLFLCYLLNYHQENYIIKFVIIQMNWE